MGLFDSVKKIIAGDVAHDAADSGNPVKIGGVASSTPFTAVAPSDRVQAWFDTSGRQVVRSDGYIKLTTALNATPATNEDLYLDISVGHGIRAVGFVVNNNTGVSVRIRLYLFKGLNSVIFDRTLAHGEQLIVGPAAAGEGAVTSYAAVPALAFNLFDKISLRYTVSGTPSGTLLIYSGTMS